jgi:septal ring-binding cell division protein DamX
MAAINLDRIGQELEQLERYVSGKRAAGAPAEGDAAGASSARVNMSSSTQLPVKPDDSLIPDKESIVAPSEGASTSTASGATPAQAATTPASPTPASASPGAAPAAPSVAAPPPAAAPVPEKDPLLGESRQWVRDLPANGWVLQHAALETLDEAKKLKAGASSLQEARILMTQRKAKGYYYIVVTGPYANRAAAQDQMKKNPSWSKAWLRGPKSMQQQFEE